jgi:hypothetical protein
MLLTDANEVQLIDFGLAETEKVSAGVSGVTAFDIWLVLITPQPKVQACYVFLSYALFMRVHRRRSF